MLIEACLQYFINNFVWTFLLGQGILYRFYHLWIFDFDFMARKFWQRIYS